MQVWYYNWWTCGDTGSWFSPEVIFWKIPRIGMHSLFSLLWSCMDTRESGPLLYTRLFNSTKFLVTCISVCTTFLQTRLPELTLPDRVINKWSKGYQFKNKKFILCSGFTIIYARLVRMCLWRVAAAKINKAHKFAGIRKPFNPSI